MYVWSDPQTAGCFFLMKLSTSNRVVFLQILLKERSMAIIIGKGGLVQGVHSYGSNNIRVRSTRGSGGWRGARVAHAPNHQNVDRHKDRRSASCKSGVRKAVKNSGRRKSLHRVVWPAWRPTISQDSADGRVGREVWEEHGGSLGLLWGS